MSYSRDKLRHAATVCCDCFFIRHPVVYFWTFTIAENVTCKAEVERRFKPFKDLVKRRGGHWLAFWERQERGAWHVHVLTETYFEVEKLRPWMIERGWGPWMKVKRCQPKAHYNGEQWVVDLSSVERLVRYLVKYVTKSLEDDQGGKIRPFAGCKPARTATVSFKWVPWERPFSYLWHMGRSLYCQMYNEFPSWKDSRLLIRMGAEDVGWEAIDPWFIPP